MKCVLFISGQFQKISIFSKWPENQVNIYAEQIKRGSTGSMLQEHFMISGTFESETHKNKQPDLIINNIYEYH